MNQYEAEAARESISGYMIDLRPGESHEAYFDRAKAECVKHLQHRVDVVLSMDYELYLKSARHKNYRETLAA